MRSTRVGCLADRIDAGIRAISPLTRISKCTKKRRPGLPGLPLSCAVILLFQQVEFFVRAVDPTPLSILPAIRQAAARVINDHATVEIEKCPRAIAVLHRLPLIVAR